MVNTPIRRLEGVTYWVIEDTESVSDFINTEIRKEWETDARFEKRGIEDDAWLGSLTKRRWSLEILDVDLIKLNPAIMSHVDEERGYSFSHELAGRGATLRDMIKEYGAVIWPVVVRKDDLVLADGYCRYTALKLKNVRKTYAYLGTLLSLFARASTFFSFFEEDVSVVFISTKVFGARQ